MHPEAAMTIPDLGSGLLDVVVRTTVVYLAIVLVLRVAGKRQVGQLSIIDLVLLLLIANGVQNAMVGSNVTVAAGIAAALTLVVLDRLLGMVEGRSSRVRKAVEGEPRLLVRHGIVLTRALQREGVTEDELLAALRQHGVSSVGEVGLAVLETSGAISVIPESAATSTSPTADPR
jgi:uncharacterized membrane protein YcaP (DUF421 family)